MDGTGMLPLVLALQSGVTGIDTGCIVQDSINHSVKNNETLKASFWGNIKNVSPFMKMRLNKQAPSKDYFYVKFNQTHVETRDAVLASFNKPASVKVMTGPVWQGWRLFNLMLSDSKILTITDDFNTTWIDEELNDTVSNLEITVENFNPLCIALTPTWRVGKTRVTVNLSSPQQEDLHFTLVAKEVEANSSFYIGNETINLGMVLPKTPTRLKMRQTPGAVPAKVTGNTWEQVIEIGNATSVGVLASSDIFILQHLGRRACPLSAGEEDFDSMGHCCCIPDYAVAFLWVAAASSVVTYYCLRRIFELITKQASSDNALLHSLSPEAIYEEIDWL